MYALKTTEINHRKIISARADPFLSNRRTVRHQRDFLGRRPGQYNQQSYAWLNYTCCIGCLASPEHMHAWTARTPVATGYLYFRRRRCCKISGDRAHSVSVDDVNSTQVLAHQYGSIGSIFRQIPGLSASIGCIQHQNTVGSLGELAE